MEQMGQLRYNRHNYCDGTAMHSTVQPCEIDSLTKYIHHRDVIKRSATLSRNCHSCSDVNNAPTKRKRTSMKFV